MSVVQSPARDADSKLAHAGAALGGNVSERRDASIETLPN